MDILSSITGTGNPFRKPELRWGIFGTSRIAEDVILAIRKNKNNQVIAVAGRNLSSTRDYADRLQVPVAYGSYDELLGDATIQAVYIPLPNSLHMPWTIKALQAGKHVLVEKPFALNSDEGQQMIAHSVEKSLVLMEGFNYRYHSRIQKAVEMIKKGELGKLRFVEGSFSFSLENPNDFRLVPELGGGAMYDLGCYFVDFMRMAVGREPEVLQARCFESGSGVDLQTQVQLDFGNQVFGSFNVGLNSVFQNQVRVVGTDAILTLDHPFSGHNKSVSTIVEWEKEVQRVNYRAEDTFETLFEHFYNVVIKKEVPRFPLADSLKNMVVIDAIFQSAADNGKLISLK